MATNNKMHIEIPVIQTNKPQTVTKDWCEVDKNGVIVGEYDDYGCQTLLDNGDWYDQNRGAVLHFNKVDHAKSYVTYHTLNKASYLKDYCDLYTTWNGGDIILTVNWNDGSRRVWIKEGFGIDSLRLATSAEDIGGGVIAFNTFDSAIDPLDQMKNLMIVTPDMKYMLRARKDLNQYKLAKLTEYDRKIRDVITPIEYDDNKVYMISAANEMDVTDLAYYIVIRIPNIVDERKSIALVDCDILAVLSEKEILKKHGIDNPGWIDYRGLVAKFILDGLWEFVDSGDGYVISNLDTGDVYDIEDDGIDILQKYK